MWGTGGRQCKVCMSLLMLHRFCVSEWYVCGRSLYQLAGSPSACCRSCMVIPFPHGGFWMAVSSYIVLFPAPIFRVQSVHCGDCGHSHCHPYWLAILSDHWLPACHTGVTCLLSSADILRLFDPEDERNAVLRNIGTYLLNYMTQCYIYIDLNLLPQIVLHVTTRAV